ncbi:LOW QUALITY PROTEIN: uncharacterized protein LOC111044132 [Nilaparvata lugens]|uniref:LOW QUALITY PROTEIN: uncharacterized protein LOC111044132 n=1 Tax=Nilaparvata lugens TaxID=108931 RepID=UPI00193CA031|nr:LOW QUALITY PROTEIN: uncharacterized protein LOC111044132 [Nilaparvata lugens]
MKVVHPKKDKNEEEMKMRINMRELEEVTPTTVLGQVYNAGSSSTVQLETSIEAGAPSPLITQTVYGFLDFTTTIGNTLMIFSPQSQAAAVPEVKPSASVDQSPAPQPPPSTSTLVDTRPPSDSPKTSDIKPSKTVTSSQKPSSSANEKKVLDEKKEKTTISKKGSSVVNVKTQSASTPKILSSVVEVVGGPVTNTPKVAAEILTTAKTQPSIVVFSKVEESPAPVVFSSQVNIVSSGKVEEAPNDAPKASPKASPKVASPVKPPQVASSKVQVLTSSKEEPAISGNNLDAEAEYDFLSRQPSEVVDETYKVIDLRTPNSKSAKHNRPPSSARLSNADSVHPTGLVTSMGGTIVKDGVTTVHETSVLGTYINGKYAQILHSTSHIYGNHHHPNKKVKPTSASQHRILKTAAPQQNRANTRLEPTPASTLQEESALPLEALFNSPPSGNLIRQSRRPAVGNSPPFKNQQNRLRGAKAGNQPAVDLADNEDDVAPYNLLLLSYCHPCLSPYRLTGQSRFSRPSKGGAAAPPHAPNSDDQLATVSVYSESPASSSRRYQSSSSSSSSQNTPSSQGQSRRGGFRPGDKGGDREVARERDSGRESGGRRNFKPSKASSNSNNDHQSTSLYKFKLSRPSGRWQYKTTPKPRIQIRRQDNDLENNHNAAQQQLTTTADQSTSSDLEGSNSEVGSAVDQLLDQAVNSGGQAAEPTVTAETIKVEISTPADFKDTYYEIQTIKSPYTFQVGTIKNTRFITVTSTVEKSLVEPTEAPQLRPSEPLTENILATATQNVYDNKEPPLDSSVATLPPIALAGDAETPPLETMTESFSTTQLMLKTHLLPVVRAGNTSTYTLVQSYHVTRLVTAVKTLPPMEVYQFVPSKTLNEFNTRLDEAGSELHLELEFGDNNNNDDLPSAKAFPPDLDLANVGSEFDLSEMDKTKFPDMHLRLKKAHQNAPAQQNQIQPVSTTQELATPSLSPEQLQQLALYRFLNPNAPLPPQLLTTSRPVLKVETIYESHVIPLFNGQSTLFSTISRPIATVSKTEYEVVTNSLALPPVQPPVNTINPFLQQPQPQFAVTSTPIVTQTMVTATDSKVLKLTFGAKTAYTTLYSTRVVPTVLTTYLTANVPVQPTVAAFPGYFPAPFNPYLG